ncbi:MAG: hypothetical protein AAB858_00390, partial [Patescibacteria group bacterium]
MSYYHLNGTHIFKRSQTKGISAAHFAERNTKFGGGKSEGGQKIPSPQPPSFLPARASGFVSAARSAAISQEFCSKKVRAKSNSGARERTRT